MRLGAKAACAAAALALAFAAGRLSAPKPETRTVTETVHETVTVVQTIHQVHEKKAEQVERVVERKVAVPCVCRQGAQGDPTGIVVMDERVFERAVSSSERLEIGAFSSGEKSLKASSSKAETSASGPTWSVGAGVGWSWSDREPVLMLEASRKVWFLKTGVWAVGSKTLHGAAGVSLSADF